MSTRPVITSVIVLYDAACPVCVKDRKLYQKLIGSGGKNIKWCDLNQHQALLAKHQISTIAAISELHVIINDDIIVKEIDAYIILFDQIWWLKPLALLLAIPLIKKHLAQIYHKKVQARLKRSGRL